MKKQKPLTKQQVIIQKHVVNPFTTMPNEWHKAMGKMMDEWGVCIIEWLEASGIDFSCYPPDSTSAKELYKEFIEETKNKIK